jgi:hypothetical protein
MYFVLHECQVHSGNAHSDIFRRIIARLFDSPYSQETTFGATQNVNSRVVPEYYERHDSNLRAPVIDIRRLPELLFPLSNGVRPALFEDDDAVPRGANF